MYAPCCLVATRTLGETGLGAYVAARGKPRNSVTAPSSPFDYESVLLPTCKLRKAKRNIYKSVLLPTFKLRQAEHNIYKSVLLPAVKLCEAEHNIYKAVLLPACKLHKVERNILSCASET